VKLPSLSVKLGLAALVLILLLLALLLLSPAEAELNWVVKLVYLHVGLVWSALIFYAVSVFVSVTSFFTKRNSLAFWGESFILTALVFWVLYFVSSLLVAYLAWGGVNWAEPRLRIAVEVMVAVSVLIALAMVGEERVKRALYYGLAGLAAWVLWLTRTSMLHPEQPIRRSPSLAIKIFAGGIFLDIFLLSIVLAIYLKFRSVSIGQSKVKVN
jgi:hypothetical protein